MPELFCGPHLVAWLAKATDVVVGVWSAFGKRDDVVGDRGWGDVSLGLAVPAEWLVSQSASALLNSSSASQAGCSALVFPFATRASH
jgi:hypothetical protein